MAQVFSQAYGNKKKPKAVRLHDGGKAMFESIIKEIQQFDRIIITVTTTLTEMRWAAKSV